MININQIQYIIIYKNAPLSVFASVMHQLFLQIVTNVIEK